MKETQVITLMLIHESVLPFFWIYLGIFTQNKNLIINKFCFVYLNHGIPSGVQSLFMWQWLQ